MSNREQLFEKYEDALFALLMDDLAEVEGERLLELNEALKDDPDAAVPIDVQQRCIDIINREFAKKKRTASRQRAKKVLKIFPWAVVIAMALMAVAMAAFPAFRAGVYNIFKSSTTEYTSWSFGDSSFDQSKKWDSDLSFTLDIPEEFVAREVITNQFYERVYFENNDGSNSSFSVVYSDNPNNVAFSNNENILDRRTLILQGYEAEFLSNNTSIWVNWANPNVPCYFSIESSFVDEQVVINILESLALK